MTVNPELSPAARLARTSRSTVLLGQVLSLVSAAIAFVAAGAYVGRVLSPSVGLVLWFGAVGMVLAEAFGGRAFRTGTFAVVWLFGIGLVLGLGLGPTLAHYTSIGPTAVAQAAVVTSLVVVAMGVAGLVVDKDLSTWMRPLAVVLLGVIVLSVVLLLLGAGDSPWLSLVIALVSAVLILVDLNYLRHHGTEDDVVLLATGLTVSIVNIFLSLLNIFSRE
jgi:modulator of FtsH protease